MDYRDTLAYLFSSLPMYQRIGRAAYKSDLDTTIKLDNYFRNPHRSFKTIHIAGTNGKGSVSHMLASVLQSAGYKTGLYTSPHFIDFRERIRINGNMVSMVYVVDFVENNLDVIERLKPSFFEITAAMAFQYFKQENVEIAVIETGMGGRLDSTNIIIPELSIITNIGLDHTFYLGDTLQKIAAEKAGIIKHKIPVVIGQVNDEVRDIFIAKAREMQSEIFFAEDHFSVEKYEEEYTLERQVVNILKKGTPALEKLITDMIGDFQKLNILTVMQAFEILKRDWELDTDSFRTGLGDVKGITGFKGRWQIIRQSPLVICDSGHNYDGLRLSISQLQEFNMKKTHIVLGMVNDKDVDSMLGLFPDDAVYYFTRASIPRAMEQETLKKKALRYSLKGRTYRSVKEAYNAALLNANTGDIIFVGGSTFVVADLLDYLNIK